MPPPRPGHLPTSTVQIVLSPVLTTPIPDSETTISSNPTTIEENTIKFLSRPHISTLSPELQIHITALELFVLVTGILLLTLLLIWLSVLAMDYAIERLKNRYGVDSWVYKLVKGPDMRKRRAYDGCDKGETYARIGQEEGDIGIEGVLLEGRDDLLDKDRAVSVSGWKRIGEKDDIESGNDGKRRRSGNP